MRSRTVVFRCLGWLLLALLLALPLGAALMLQTAASVPPPAAISPADVERARLFLRRNDPRQTPPGELRTVRVGQAELSLLMNYLSSRYPRAAARLQLRPDDVRAEASLALAGPFWLNASARLVPNGGLPHLQDLRLGRLPVPDFMASWARERLLERWTDTEEARLARQLVKHVGLDGGQLTLVYEWQPDGYRRLLDSLLPMPEQARLRVYADRLLQLAGAHGGAPMSLSAALPPLFALALERSAAGEDAAAENRALLLVLAAQASGRGLGALLPAARDWPRPALEFSLHGRPDFPMHWLISAALAAHAGGPLADAVGIYKEIADTRDGSGFSFNDIAADRAGSRLGQMAVSAPRGLQQRLAAGVAELELLPDVSDLPEFLSAAEFRQRYGAVGSPAYRAMQQDIEARLDANPLLSRAHLLP
ncbi:hypothetical protein G8A07_27445 [Roseateles sp. DAIF2]|uniref:hypothetical protein n=1 Tax=Roseateles sp. DAIF2 TaxID=2714952 RepID=UPI0018A31E14|nr:hypothetical protein [Roseateles sp. DAIF2]QPF76298.1 hypothetical protein G8A07_27445 [Roseateles sp. DAIF2]